MAIYLKPPGGKISLQKLSHFAVTRFKFLLQVYQHDGDRVKMQDLIMESVSQSECLIEESVKDRISHFILRLICCRHDEMSKLLVAAETLFFDFHFSCMTYKELVKLFTTLDPFLTHGTCDLGMTASSSSHLRQIFETFLSIKSAFQKWKCLVEKYLSGGEECFTVPFQTVLQLVSRRKVVLERGVANVPVWRLREVVTNLFREMLESEISVAMKNTCILDERIHKLARQIKALFYQTIKKTRPNCGLPRNLSHANIDALSPQFPPCMANLHRSLRTHHRLHHHERIQYTLFLKELGLPVHEALMFWRKEYSLSPSNRHGTCHDWSSDGNRYTYNIRHLYGLEGSRINYRGHTCTALQMYSPNPTAGGGCPFTQFDQDHLMDLLTSEGVCSHANHILEPTLPGHACQACWAYQQAKIKECIKHTLSPVQKGHMSKGEGRCDERNDKHGQSDKIMLNTDVHINAKVKDREQLTSVDGEECSGVDQKVSFEKMDTSTFRLSGTRSTCVERRENHVGHPSGHEEVCINRENGDGRNRDNCLTDINSVTGVVEECCKVNRTAVAGKEVVMTEITGETIKNDMTESTEETIKDGMTSITSETIKDGSTELTGETDKAGSTTTRTCTSFTKPIDYFISYKALLDQLKGDASVECCMKMSTFRT